MKDYEDHHADRLVYEMKCLLELTLVFSLRQAYPLTFVSGAGQNLKPEVGNVLFLYIIRD